MAQNPLDLSGSDLIVNNVYQGASTSGSAGTLGTASTQTFTGVKTFSANPAFTVGNTIKSNVASATLTSNAATVTSYFTQITTESLTTAAGASQALVLTLTGVAAGDIAFVQDVGGTNTRYTYQYKAACTTNTITITVYNSGPTNALNGTLVFNVWVLKA
jgi:hypothetical protein